MHGDDPPGCGDGLSQPERNAPNAVLRFASTSSASVAQTAKGYQSERRFFPTEVRTHVPDRKMAVDRSCLAWDSDTGALREEMNYSCQSKFREFLLSQVAGVCAGGSKAKGMDRVA